jgi:hypothetical protein
MDRLMRAPYSVRLKMSRPKRSVPIGCETEGAWYRVATMSVCASGS